MLKELTGWLERGRPWSIAGIAVAAVAAIAWATGLATWQVLAIGLALGSIGITMASTVARRAARGAPRTASARVLSADGDFDPDEVIAQDINSGRLWRLGDVHFLSAAEKRRLAAERPHVWTAYRARLFPLRPPTAP